MAPLPSLPVPLQTADALRLMVAMSDLLRGFALPQLVAPCRSLKTSRGVRGPHALEHRLDIGARRRDERRIACADHQVGVRARLVIEERIGADRHARMRFRDLAELGADVAL